MAVALDGSAIPCVCETENPSSSSPDVLSQNLPKLSPLPGLVELSTPAVKELRPGCVASANFAISISAMYAYQLPSVDWSILIFCPFIVTVGSPCASSCDDIEESDTITSTTIGPVT